MHQLIGRIGRHMMRLRLELLLVVTIDRGAQWAALLLVGFGLAWWLQRRQRSVLQAN